MDWSRGWCGLAVRMDAIGCEIVWNAELLAY
jgi:hypothetical protein